MSPQHHCPGIKKPRNCRLVKVPDGDGRLYCKTHQTICAIHGVPHLKNEDCRECQPTLPKGQQKEANGIKEISAIFEGGSQNVSKGD